MKIRLVLLTAVLLLLASCKTGTKKNEYKSISPKILKDKIAGGWAGKMIGVTYGAPVEFKSGCKIFEDSINWKPKDVIGSRWQDDLYVQLTFLMAMDRFGDNVSSKELQKMLATAGYPLWHANMQTRKNYFDSIFPPMSGNPKYSMHSDDIDFQIEADYIGFMCPAMPSTAAQMADRIGHIMNYGDGVYGGIYISALYCNAFFENDMRALITKALQTIPAQSQYAQIIKDVLTLSKEYPDNWRKAWQKLNDKWGRTDVCVADNDMNIDAKLNGAFVTLGLIYGKGDPMSTMEITTRSGQDADCNPSNAMAVLGIMKGFSGLPKEMQNAVAAMQDTLFDNTSLSYKMAVEDTYKHALGLIKENGGQIKSDEISIKVQQPLALQLEVSYPGMVFKGVQTVFDAKGWKFSNHWKTYQTNYNHKREKQSKFAEKAGEFVEIPFNGTGISVEGNWWKDGGLADIYIDGKINRTIDTYYNYAKQQHTTSICHVLNLNPGNHILRIVVKGKKRPESAGTKIYLTKAIIYTTR